MKHNFEKLCKVHRNLNLNKYQYISIFLLMDKSEHRLSETVKTLILVEYALYGLCITTAVILRDTIL